jgi:hypothetical protein
LWLELVTVGEAGEGVVEGEVEEGWEPEEQELDEERANEFDGLRAVRVEKSDPGGFHLEGLTTLGWRRGRL